MINRLSAFAVVAAIVGFTATTTRAASIDVDHWGAGVNLSTAFGPTSAVNDGLHADVLGGYRDTTLALTSGTGAFVLFSPVLPNSGEFVAFTTTTGIFTSLYDGFDNNGLNLNLVTASNNDRFRIQSVAVDGTAELTLEVVDMFGGIGSLTQVLPDQFSGDLVYNFADFGVDMTSVKSVKLVLETTSSATDVTLGKISAIPEPASMALMGLGSLMLLSRRRRTA